MNLLEKIDELRAKSVTPEKFEKMWGYSIDTYVDKMMALVEQLDAEDAAAYSDKKQEF